MKLIHRIRPLKDRPPAEEELDLIIALMDLRTSLLYAAEAYPLASPEIMGKLANAVITHHERCLPLLPPDSSQWLGIGEVCVSYIFAGIEHIARITCADGVCTTVRQIRTTESAAMCSGLSTDELHTKLDAVTRR